MVTGALERGRSLDGLQPFDPTRDLDDVADLLRLAFRDELGQRDTAWLDDMHTLGALKPLVWVLDQVNAAIGPLLHGFVWFEDSELVGNVTLSRVSSLAWLISNMAVHPRYRRHGIGRALMEASIDWVRGRGARRITLEVRHDNPAAKSLYASFGFEVSRVTAALKLTRVVKLPDDVEAAPGYRLRQGEPADSQAITALARETTSSLEQQLEPIRLRDYRVKRHGAAFEALHSLLGLPMTRWWVAEHGANVVGGVKLRTSGHDHRLTLVVQPGHRGAVERPLLVRALRSLSGDRGGTSTEVDATHEAALATLRECGFTETRTLARMVLELV